jgi:hypothetical protein
MRVLTGSFTRIRRRHRIAFTEASAVTATIAEPRPSRAAVLLATAYRMQEMIDRGEVEGPAELARSHGVSRARITQILNLALQPPSVQEEILLRKSWRTASAESASRVRSATPSQR